MYLKLTSRKYGQKQLVNMDRVLWVQPDGGEGDGSVLYFDLEDDHRKHKYQKIIQAQLEVLEEDQLKIAIDYINALILGKSPVLLTVSSESAETQPWNGITK